MHNEHTLIRMIRQKMQDLEREAARERLAHQAAVPLRTRLALGLISLAVKLKPDVSRPCFGPQERRRYDAWDEESRHELRRGPNGVA